MKRIKVVIKVAFVTGILIGGIGGGIIGYHIGTGNLYIELPEQCKWRHCDCYNDNPYHYHCIVHGNGHECY
jgi:hypothetical protein